MTRRALRRRHWSAPERGSGTVLALGVLGAVMLLTAVLLPLFAALVVGQAVQGAADAAALAAADTASGAVAGVPCAAAAEAARLNGASVTVCTVEGLIASVTAVRGYLGFELGAQARAGPPDSPGGPAG
ncbi:Rv3654c family TadE-like protein [Cryobacterium sp. TMT1-19]|uniref:Rv3654c family TadE-like protein n=1 Tax=Cryobacterium sp. TMT1-19 TaxID=1259231 RepID=UPI001F53F3D7|nr:Rv3654c family TadE-like protein [Cryobacterium sp. TMT1-19]